ERPERRVVLERVDETEVLGDHPGRRTVLVDRLVEPARRHQRESGEADERDQRGERERVAPPRVSRRIAEEQPHERTDRDDEVRGAVVDVPELDEALPW